MMEEQDNVQKRIYFSYTREDLRNAVRDILNGVLSIPDAAHKYTVPESTLRDNVRKALKELKPENGIYKEITTVKEHKGHDKALSEDLEQKLKCFIEDCERIGLPCCQKRCSLHIQCYLKSEGIHCNYFVDERPGRDYIRRLCSNNDGSSIYMMRGSEVDDELNKQIDVEKWVVTLKQYVMDVRQECFPDKRRIFVMESQTFRTYTEPHREISVMLIYNGLGEIVKWIIVSDGSVMCDDFIIQHSETGLFLKSDDGRLNSTTLKNAMIVTRRFVLQHELEGDYMVLMDKNVMQDFGFVVWNYCYENFCYPMAIPRSLCSAARMLNVGPMSRYTSLMLFYIHTRYIALEFSMDETEFTLVHQGVVKNLKPMSQINKLFSLLKLTSIVCQQRHYQETEVEGVNEEATLPMEVPQNVVLATTSKSQSVKKKRRRRGPKIMVSVGTQTPKQSEPSKPTDNTVPGEEAFKKNHSDEVKDKLLVDVIRKEDFESDSDEDGKDSISAGSSKGKQTIQCGKSDFVSKLNKSPPGGKGLKKSK